MDSNMDDENIDNKSTKQLTVTYKSENSSQRELKVNFGYLVRITMVIGLSSMQFGFCMAGTGPVLASLRYQLKWDPS